MDDIKKFCYDNKDGMDTELPGAAVWINIEQKLNAAQKGRLVSRSFIYRAAAASVIIIAATAYYYLADSFNKGTVSKALQQSSQPKMSRDEDIAVKTIDEPADVTSVDHGQNQLSERVVSTPIKYSNALNKSKATPLIKKVDKEKKIFNELQISYGQMVTYQIKKLSHTPIYAENAEYFILFKTQFNDLDKDEKQLREETKRSGINDDIIMRMINIYQEKILLLKELQSEIIKMNNRYRSTIQDPANLKPSFIKL